MALKENKILLHACCAVCSGYPISLLKEIGYVPVVYFCNPNLDTQEEFERRLSAQKTVCSYFDRRVSVIDTFKNGNAPYIPSSSTLHCDRVKMATREAIVKRSALVYLFIILS